MKNIFIGIDFSKEKIDVAVIKAVGLEEIGERQFSQFKTTPAGYRSLISWVKELSGDYQQDSWLFCGENTGGYSIGLCDYLYGKGYDMWLENAKSIVYSVAMKRGKSDKADAAMIAEYAMRNYDKARFYKPLSDSLSQLRELFLYRHSLVQQKCRFQVRGGEKKFCLGKSSAKNLILRSSNHLLKEIIKEIAKVEQSIQKLIASDESLMETYEIVTSMPGIGFVNATCLLVYTANFTKFDFDSRKIACYYGVAPFGRDSGTSVHLDPHVHYMANKLIKSYLTQAALAAARYCEPISRYYHRLLVRGKKMQVALNNVKNKILHTVTAMVKNKTKYKADYDYAKAVLDVSNQIC